MSAPLLFGHLPVPPLAAWSLSDLWKSVVSVGKGLHLESVGQSWLSVTLWSVGVLLGVAILVATGVVAGLVGLISIVGVIASRM